MSGELNESRGGGEKICYKIDKDGRLGEEKGRAKEDIRAGVRDGKHMVQRGGRGREERVCGGVAGRKESVGEIERKRREK